MKKRSNDYVNCFRPNYDDYGGEGGGDDVLNDGADHDGRDLLSCSQGHWTWVVQVCLLKVGQPKVRL